MSVERWLNPPKVFVNREGYDTIVHLKRPLNQKPYPICGLHKRRPGNWRYDSADGIGAKVCGTCERLWSKMVADRKARKLELDYASYHRNRDKRLAEKRQYAQENRVPLKKARAKRYGQENQRRQERRERQRRLQASNDQRPGLAQDQELSEVRDAG